MMVSLRQRLNRGLMLILRGIFAMHWFAADWVIRIVAEQEMMTRLEHNSDTLLASLKNANGNILPLSALAQLLDSLYSEKKCSLLPKA